MDHSRISGIFWIALSIVFFLKGVVLLVRGTLGSGMVFILLGALIVSFELYLYRKTGKISGVF